LNSAGPVALQQKGIGRGIDPEILGFVAQDGDERHQAENYKHRMVQDQLVVPAQGDVGRFFNHASATFGGLAVRLSKTP
jgi:hypothetical protein